MNAATDTVPDGNRGRSRSVAIVGAGFGGVGAAVMLRRAGYEDVTVFERGERVVEGHGHGDGHDQAVGSAA